MDKRDDHEGLTTELSMGPRLGSTAHQIVQHSHCPVLVNPPIGHSTSAGEEPG